MELVWRVKNNPVEVEYFRRMITKTLGAYRHISCYCSIFIAHENVRYAFRGIEIEHWREIV